MEHPATGVGSTRRQSYDAGEGMNTFFLIILFVNLVMDGLGAIMLGNEPALQEYMLEKPRRRDESIISRKMAVQIGVMGAWLTIISFVYLKAPFFGRFFASEEQHLTGYFVLFIVSALFNGFNVRDEGLAIFRGLNENTGFMKVFCIIVLVQALIVNAALVPGSGSLRGSEI